VSRYQRLRRTLRSPVRWAKLRKRDRRLQRQLDRQARPLAAVYERVLPAPPYQPVLAAPRLCARRLAIQERVRDFYAYADAPVSAYLRSKGWVTA
jgi:hypothetical protein